MTIRVFMPGGDVEWPFPSKGAAKPIEPPKPAEPPPSAPPVVGGEAPKVVSSSTRRWGGREPR